MKMASERKRKITGWLQEAGADFENDRDFLEVTDFSQQDLAPEYLAYFREYQDKYFNHEFVRGQGTEDILETLQRHGTGGDWLDLGSGTSTLFWSIPLTGLSSITCCDLVIEALAVLAEFIASDRVPVCYQQALDMFPGDRPESDQARPDKPMERMRGRFPGSWRYLVFDATKPWPAQLARQYFDLITSIGLFSTTAGPKQYAECFTYLSAHLRADGRAIGADWIRSPALVHEEGHDSSYTSVSLVTRAGADAGLRPLDCRRVDIQGDPLYQAVIVWAFEKPTMQ